MQIVALVQIDGLTPGTEVHTGLTPCDWQQQLFKLLHQTLQPMTATWLAAG